MVKHSLTLQRSHVPQWRDEYVDYDRLSSLLAKAVKEVHKVLDKHLQVRTSIAAESTTTLRKRKGGKHKTTPLCPDDEGDECGLPETPPEAVTVVIDMLPAHKAFVESFAEELEKANAWYASKLVELKFEFLHLVLVAVKLGLVPWFEVEPDSDRTHGGHTLFDPGSTISLVAQEHQTAHISLEHAHLGGGKVGGVGVDKVGGGGVGGGVGGASLRGESNRSHAGSCTGGQGSTSGEDAGYADTRNTTDGAELPSLSARMVHGDRRGGKGNEAAENASKRRTTTSTKVQIRFEASAEVQEDSGCSASPEDPRIVAIEEWLFSSPSSFHSNENGENNDSGNQNKKHRRCYNGQRQQQPSRPDDGGNKQAAMGDAGEAAVDVRPYLVSLFNLKGAGQGQPQRDNDLDHLDPDLDPHRSRRRKSRRRRKVRELTERRVAALTEALRLDVLEFYRECCLLVEFGEQNSVTLRKVLKKHRKELGGRLDQAMPLKPLLVPPACPFRTDASAFSSAASSTTGGGGGGALSRGGGGGGGGGGGVFFLRDNYGKNKNGGGDAGGSGSSGGGGSGQATLRHLLAITEGLYIDAFASKEGTAKERKKAAMKFLTVDGTAQSSPLFGTWRFGGACGYAAVTAVLIVYLSNFPNNTPAAAAAATLTAMAGDSGLGAIDDSGGGGRGRGGGGDQTCDGACSAAVISLYRLSGVCLVFSWVWFACAACSLYFRVDYALVVHYDPRKMFGKPSVHSFEALCGFTVLWFGTVAATLASVKGAPYWNVPTAYLSVYPLALTAVGCVVLALRERATGFWFSTCAVNVVRAPTVAVTFKDTFVADQFTSLTIVLRDSFFTACFVAHGDFANNGSGGAGCGEAADDDELNGQQEGGGWWWWSSPSHSSGAHVCLELAARYGPLIACLPATWRALQCLRRYRDSCLGKDHFDRKATRQQQQQQRQQHQQKQQGRQEMGQVHGVHKRVVCGGGGDEHGVENGEADNFQDERCRRSSDGEENDHRVGVTGVAGSSDVVVVVVANEDEEEHRLQSSCRRCLLRLLPLSVCRCCCLPCVLPLSRYRGGNKVHLYNTLKYCVTYPLVACVYGLNAFDPDNGNGNATWFFACRGLWWVFAALDVGYKYYWDVVHDWGLGAMHNRGLRPRLEVEERRRQSSSSSSSSNNNQHDDVNENFQRQRKGEEQEEEEEEERERQTTEKVNPVHNNDDDDGDKTTTRSTTPGSATTAVGAPLLDVVRLRPNSANHLYPEATYYAIAAVNLLLRMASPLLITSSLLYADGRHGEGFGLFGLSSAPSSFPHPCHGGNSGGGDDSSGGGSGADGADGADGGGGGGGSPSFPLTPLVLACALSVAEVCRRGLWNLLRLEHRHLAHCRERCARQTARLEHFYQSGGGGVVGNGCNANDRHSTPSSFLASVSSSSSSLVSPLSTPPRDTDTATAAATATQQDEDVEDNEGDDGDVFAVLTTTTPLFLSDEWLTAKLRQRAIGSSSSSSSSPHLDLCDNDNGDASNDEVRAFGSDGRSDGQSMTGRGLAGGGSEGSSDDGYERRRRYGGSDSGGGGGDEEGFVGGGGYGGDLGAQQQHQHQQQHRSRTAVDPDDDDFTPFNTNATSRQQQQQQNLNRQRTRSSRGRNSSGRNDYQWRQQPPRSSAFSSYRSSPPTDMNTDTARDGGAELAGAAESVTRGGLSSVVEEGTLRGRSTDTTVTLSDYNDEDDDEDETKDDDDDDDLDESGDFDDGFGV